MLLDLLVPPSCLACGAPRGDPLCAGCRAALPWLRDACPRCALPRPCRPCPAKRAHYDSAVAATAHEGPARELVLALKLRGSRPAADAMAAAMAARIRAAPQTSEPHSLADVVLVPVPPSPERRRRRGYDPAEVLVRQLAKRTGQPVERCLARARGDGKQAGERRAARRAGPHVEAQQHAPTLVLLVDDVHTTGATLEACARALKQVGSRQICAVTYARTLRRA